MERRRYEFVLEAEQPIAHHEETFGNLAVSQRRRMRFNGGWAHVPVVTADTMRHGMREAAAYALLDAAGLLDETKLTEGALRLLFSGGMVTGKGEASNVKLDQYRELCELVPSMALFGGCADNRVIPGRLHVDDATLICEEATRYIPEWATKEAGELDSGRAHVEEVQRVRMDPTLQPSKTRLLLEDAQVAVNKRLESSEKASADGDHAGKDREKSSMMPRSFERVAQGSLFSWAVEATTYTDLDVDTFHVALGAFLADAKVGGKRGTGHGKLRCVSARSIELRRTARPEEVLDTTALGGRAGDLFRAHVAERAERLAEYLTRVNA